MAALGAPWDLDPTTWWRDVETSLLGAFLWTRAVAPGMVERGGGRIVNVVSTVAARPSPYASGYAAAKAGLASLTEAVAAAGAASRLRAFAVAPGFVETAMTARLRDADVSPWFAGAGAGGSVDAARTGSLVAYLASGAADVLSGRFLHVLDDVPELVRRADEVASADAYALRLRRLPDHS
jgi:NAD(P)-dependent dehydrogenase (short-subunit alcohol dehydrogenase family)